MKNYISLGAGVQSSTLALMAKHGEVTPMPDGAIFADTQAEPGSVYKWLDWLEKQLPFPLHRATAGDLGKLTVELKTSAEGRTYWKNYIPMYTGDGKTEPNGILNRKCTADFKIAVIKRAMREVGDLSHRSRVPVVTSWIGISRDEAHRMKPPGVPWIAHRWPLIEKRMTRQDCLTWMQERGYPKPPRSACVFCPYHDDEEWLRLKRDEPEEFAKAVGIERAAAAAACSSTMAHAVFLHKSRIPLDQVDFEKLVAVSAAAKKAQLNLFGNECEGMCGV